MGLILELIPQEILESLSSGLSHSTAPYLQAAQRS